MDIRLNSYANGRHATHYRQRPPKLAGIADYIPVGRLDDVFTSKLDQQGDDFDDLLKIMRDRLAPDNPVFVQFRAEMRRYLRWKTNEALGTFTNDEEGLKHWDERLEHWQREVQRELVKKTGAGFKPGTVVAPDVSRPQDEGFFEEAAELGERLAESGQEASKSVLFWPSVAILGGLALWAVIAVAD